MNERYGWLTRDRRHLTQNRSPLRCQVEYHFEAGVCNVSEVSQYRLQRLRGSRDIDQRQQHTSIPFSTIEVLSIA